MHTGNHRRLSIVALALATGLTSCYADEGQAPANDQLENVAVEPVPLQDPAVVSEDAAGVLADSDPASGTDQPNIVADKMVDYAPAPCSCCNSTCCTKKKKEAATAKMKGAYKGVFYSNDYSYLNDKCYDGPSFFGDELKGLCCGKLDLGGEARVRYQNEDNIRGFGLTGVDDNFVLTRYRAFANYRANDYFRFYGEYLYADSGGETFNNRVIEENRGEIQNLFGDVKLTEAMTMRLGRQEIWLGSQRLVSPLDWANTRRTFDGGRLIYQGDTWNVDGFFTHPVNRNAANESKIDDTNENVDFFGLYASRSDLAIGTMDTYYIGLDDSDANFDYHTLGSRVYGQTDGGLLYEFEGGVQFGTNSNGSNHDDGFFTAGLGRQLNYCVCGKQWKPTVWMWYDWASGGDTVPGDDGFDHLFPLAHKYLGFMDLFGRRNINDVNMQFMTPFLSDKVNLLVWYHYFFLDKQTTPYNVTMSAFDPTAVAGDKELGHEIDILFNINLNPRHNVLVGYSHFFAGDYYDTTPTAPTNADGQFFYTQYQWRF